MATKKDLVDAYSFSRRRLVTAFVSGAPGGREVEPARPGRSIVGGLALAVLLIAGAAIAGVFTSNVDPAWAEKPGLIVSKEEAEVFVIIKPSTEPVLHPILNITSAKLILGSDVEPQVIPEEYISEEEIGNDLGIFGAPYDVPDVSRLIETGWTACTDGADGGLRLSLSQSPLVTPTAENGGMLVTVDRETWLIAASRPAEDGTVSAHRYRVPRAESGAQEVVLEGIGLGQGAGEVTEVSREWLNLFPEGGDVSADAFGVTPRRHTGGDPAPGDVLLVNNAPYLTAASGALARLDPFSLAVAVGSARGPLEPAEYQGDVGALDFERGGFLDARWPDTTLTPVFGERCVRLLTEAGDPSLVQLVHEPEGEAAAAGTGGESVAVEAGAGAYVLSGGWGQSSGGTPFVMDAKGYAYPVMGREGPGLLGYGGYDAPVVPDAWVELFKPGVLLSQNAALCAPRAGDQQCD